MKLRYLFASLVAAVTLFTSCNDEFEATTLDNTKVSTSYVAIPLGGGSTTIQITTTEDYTITGAPDWLTITPTSGAAGTSSITFSAEATVDGRSTEAVRLVAGDETQIINVIQGLATVSTATCAEVNAGIENKTYKVSGVCTAIANTTYGNFYINDGTGELYIYGCVDASGSYNWSKFNIEVGDEVTVQGPKVTYNGTVELKDAQFISVSKSLIKVDAVDPENGNLTSDGGDFTVTLVNKGTGLNVQVPEEAQEWLSIKSVSNNKVVFHASANVAGPRNTTLVFSTVSGGKTYTAQTLLTQDGLSGTLNVPFSVEEAIAAANNGVAGDVYVKGIVSRVLYQYSANYGTATFWISSDGTSSVTENGKGTDAPDHDFECYSVYYFNNEKWADGNAPISVGDEVMIYGKLTVYNGIAETSSKAAYVYSINGVSNDANGVGSLEAPFTAPGAIAAANNGYTGKAYISGIVSDVLYTFSSAYGTATFWISEDGTSSVTENKKSTNAPEHDFEVYSCYYLGNQPWAEGNDQIAEGDKVVVYGNLTVYNGIAETASKKSYVYSHNGKTE